MNKVKKTEKNNTNILLKYLDSKEMRMSEFARLMGVSLPTVWTYVKGNTKPSRVNALKIQRATDGEITLKDFGYEA